MASISGAVQLSSVSYLIQQYWNMKYSHLQLEIKHLAMYSQHIRTCSAWESYYAINIFSLHFSSRDILDESKDEQIFHLELYVVSCIHNTILQSELLK